MRLYMLRITPRWSLWHILGISAFTNYPIISVTDAYNFPRTLLQFIGRKAPKKWDKGINFLIIQDRNIYISKKSHIISSINCALQSHALCHSPNKKS